MPKTLGVIGGMGPAATVNFLHRVVELTGELPEVDCDQQHLHVLVDNDPSVPDRTAAIEGRGPDPSPKLAEMARGLEAAGADLLVMPCNSAHFFAEAVTSAVRIPLVDWPGVVAEHAAARDMSRLGLLATTGTVKGKIYHRALEAVGGAAIVPGETDQGEVMAVIEAIKRNPRRREETDTDAAAAIRRVGAGMAAKGAEALLLACTELALLGVDRLRVEGGAVEVLDAAEIVASRVVSLAYLTVGP